MLLYDDAAPRDALEAAVHARARLGATVDEGAAEAGAAAVADAGWRVDERARRVRPGRLLRAAPEVKEERIGGPVKDSSPSGRGRRVWGKHPQSVKDAYGLARARAPPQKLRARSVSGWESPKTRLDLRKRRRASSRPRRRHLPQRLPRKRARAYQVRTSRVKVSSGPWRSIIAGSFRAPTIAPLQTLCAATNTL